MNENNMDLINAFKFNNDNYDRFKEFDIKISSFKKNLIIAILIALKWTGISILIKFWVSKKIKNKRLKQNPTVVFLFSINQGTVFDQLIKLGMNYNCYNFSVPKIAKKETVEFINIPLKMIFWSTLANSASFLKAHKEGKDNAIIQDNFFRLFKLAGCQLLFQELLQEVKVVVKFNDHCMYSTLLHTMCKHREIKTVYIQHAPVSYLFPPLHHNLNVLFSQDSIEKYKLEGPEAKIFEFFDIRLLPGKNISSEKHEKDKTQTILIGFNLLDDISEVSKLVENLKRNFKIILRPHPADMRDFSFLISEKVSVSKNKSIWSDLSASDVVVSNESAIPLEALCCNKPFYKAAMLSKPIDNYSFIKKGLITKQFFDIEELNLAIQNHEICYDLSILEHYTGDLNNYAERYENLNQEIKNLI